MKRILFALLLAVSVASAQVYPPDASSGTATSISPSAFPLLAPDGDLEAPSYSFTNLTEGGMFISGTTLVLQNQGVDPDPLSRSRASFGTEFWSLYATDNVSGTVQAYIQGASEGSGEERLRMGSTVDTNNETEIYVDADAINMRVEDAGVDEASFDLDEDSTATLTLVSGANTSTTVFNETGTTFSDPILLPDGSVSAPAFGFSTNTDVGFFLDASEFINVTLDNSIKYIFSGTALQTSANVDLNLGQNGQVTFEGSTDDTNETVFDVDDPSADRFIFLQDESGWLTAMQKGTSTLTESSATDILSFPIASTTTMAGSVILVTECDDTTNRVVTHETYDFVCINESDTEACAFSGPLGAGLEVNDGAGTFSGHAVSYTGGTNAVTFTLNAVCSLAQTLLESKWEIEFHVGAYAAVTEQN